MNLNATLLGQMITFTLFVFFTMRFIWPLLMAQLVERKKRIADGLAAAEHGNTILLEAEEKAQAKIKAAKEQCYKLLEAADLQVNQILAVGRKQALKERDDILANGRAEIERELRQAKTELQTQVVALALLGAEKILERSVTHDDHYAMLRNLAKNLA